jgi:hypothetical protein
METRLLASDLYEYLLSLALSLQQTGNDELAKRALLASKFASGSSSELYGEAQAFLWDLVRLGAPGMSMSETKRLSDVLNGIAAEFRRIGGA